MTKYNYGSKGTVWMDGRKRIATLRATRGAAKGWMLTWHDRTPYISDSPICKGAKTNCKFFFFKREAVSEVDDMLST